MEMFIVVALLGDVSITNFTFFILQVREGVKKTFYGHFHKGAGAVV